MNSKKIIPTCLFLAHFLCIFSRNTFAEDTLKIGALLCLVGDCAEYGSNSRKGIALAVEEINSRGGILGRNVEVVFEDGQDSVPRKLLLAYKKFVQRGDIRFFVGPQWSMGGQTIVPLIKENKNVIFIAPSIGIKDFAEASDNTFNTWSPDERATRMLARYAVSQGWKNVGIVGVDEVWTNTQSDTFADELVKLGGVVTARVNPLPGTADLKPDVLRVKESKPDAVFIASYFYDIVAKDMKNMGMGGIPKFAILMEKGRVKTAEGALEGTLFALGEAPIATFTHAFRSKFGIDPGISADTAYDAVMLYKKAIEEAGTADNIKKIIQSLSQIRNFTGASGTFSFDQYGIVDKKPVLWKVHGEEYERVLLPPSVSQ